MNAHDKKKCEELFAHISMVLAENGMVFPTYIMILGGQVVPVMVNPQEEMSLSEYEGVVNQAAIEMQPDAMILISEQWMVSKHKDDPEVQLLVDGIIKPSDQDDKEEYLVLIITERDGNSNSLVAKIEKDPIGTRFIREQHWIDSCVSNLIRPWKVTEVK